MSVMIVVTLRGRFKFPTTSSLVQIHPGSNTGMLSPAAVYVSSLEVIGPMTRDDDADPSSLEKERERESNFCWSM